MANANALAAITDSVTRLAEAEGPGGGPRMRERLAVAVEHYASHYGGHPPAVLAAEVLRCRTVATVALRHRQTDAHRAELLRSAGWLSALLGNLAFHGSDIAGAQLHLGSAADIGADVDDRHLAGWSLGALSMVAMHNERPREALDLAQRAAEYADTPLRRAQIAAWCHLRPLASLAEHSAATRVAAAAQRDMGRADEVPGRFGFDAAELHLHLAEAHLAMLDFPQAARDAAASAELKRTGSGGWAAATAVLARVLAAQRHSADACALAGSVLDAVPPESLRATTRRRLGTLLDELQQVPDPGPHVRNLADRLASLPLPTTVHPPRTSPENGI